MRARRIGGLPRPWRGRLQRTRPRSLADTSATKRGHGNVMAKATFASRATTRGRVENEPPNRPTLHTRTSTECSYRRMLVTGAFCSCRDVGYEKVVTNGEKRLFLEEG